MIDRNANFDWWNDLQYITIQLHVICLTKDMIVSMFYLRVMYSADMKVLVYS